MPLLGAHMSTSGGLDQAILRGKSIGCETIQLFVANPNRWQTKPFEPKEIARFQSTYAQNEVRPVIAHDIYLINLGSPDSEMWNKSLVAFEDEVCRCAQLGIPYLVMHPGAHMGAGEAAGLKRIAQSLDLVRERVGPVAVKVLLETTAGQGTVLGHHFAQLAEIMALAVDASWLGVCLDTCHVFAAGYELRTEAGYAQTWGEFERVIGLKRLVFIHLNDSKGCLGCHLDRHEHIGKGQLGLEAFRRLLNDPRVHDLPMCLETPKGPEMKEDVENLAVLRSLIRN
jgi:deoxyribonuclease IV